MKLGGRGEEKIAGNSLTEPNSIFFFLLFFSKILRVFSFQGVSLCVCVCVCNFYFLKASVGLSMMIGEQRSLGHNVKVVLCNILFLKEKPIVLYR